MLFHLETVKQKDGEFREMKFDGQRKENNDEKHTCDRRTVPVSKYIAKYYTSLGDKVHVLNRNHHP